MCFRILTIFLVFSSCSGLLSAADEYPAYNPAKVVYDLSSDDPVNLKHLLDRVSMLQNIYQNNPFEASIVIVIHEGAISLFSKKSRTKTTNNIRQDYQNYGELMTRARSLILGDIIQFKICRASARMQGFNENELMDFAELVPMADAELIMLQNSGYAYLR